MTVRVNELGSLKALKEKLQVWRLSQNPKSDSHVFRYQPTSTGGGAGGFRTHGGLLKFNVNCTAPQKLFLCVSLPAHTHRGRGGAKFRTHGGRCEI